MSKIRPAKKKATAYELSCPYCDEIVPEPNSDSHFWDVNEIYPGREMQCHLCQKKFAVPRV